jgi:hypothetical protein
MKWYKTKQMRLAAARALIKERLPNLFHLREFFSAEGADYPML